MESEEDIEGKGKKKEKETVADTIEDDSFETVIGLRGPEVDKKIASETEEFSGDERKEQRG
jgi:hypothetical protein